MTPDPHFPSRLALQLSARPAQYNLTSVLEFEDCIQYNKTIVLFLSESYLRKAAVFRKSSNCYLRYASQTKENS